MTSTSPQDFITDARTRRSLRQKGLDVTQKCTQCDYKTTSSALLNQHIEDIHQIEENQQNEIEMRPRQSCDQCGFKTTSETVLKQHTILNHSKKVQSKNSSNKSSRKKCEHCEKQFNKQETYKKHVQTVHKENIQIEEVIIQ